jgi:hypothetical protein
MSRSESFEATERPIGKEADEEGNTGGAGARPHEISVEERKNPAS